MLVILQARTASSRLPGKIFHTFFGEPIISRMLKIAKEFTSSENIILTTGSSPRDDYLSQIASDSGISVIRDDEDNVLKRFYIAAKDNTSDYIMRITCDNYLVQPRLLGAMHRECIQKNADYCYVAPLSHFAGEIIRRDLIIDEYKSNYSQMAKEHVTYEIRARTDIRILELPDNFMLINHRKRITLDNLDDLLFLKTLEAKNQNCSQVDCLEELINLTIN